jgi:hypothetical protein
LHQGAWTFQDAALQGYFQAIVWLSALISKAGEFRQMLKKPVSTAAMHATRFIGFMSSDAGEQIEEILKRASQQELGLAARLTDILSQHLSIKRSTLYEYAQFVAAVLAEPMRYIEPGMIRTDDPPTRFSFTIRTNKISVPIEDLAALIAALHRAREGPGAEALLSVLSQRGDPHLHFVREFLRSDGELQESRTQEATTWRVAEILPEVPDGPRHRTYSFQLRADSVSLSFQRSRMDLSKRTAILLRRLCTDWVIQDTTVEHRRCLSRDVAFHLRWGCRSQGGVSASEAPRRSSG